MACPVIYSKRLAISVQFPQFSLVFVMRTRKAVLGFTLFLSCLLSHINKENVRPRNGVGAVTDPH